MVFSTKLSTYISLTPAVFILTLRYAFLGNKISSNKMADFDMFCLTLLCMNIYLCFKNSSSHHAALLCQELPRINNNTPSEIDVQTTESLKDSETNIPLLQKEKEPVVTNKKRNNSKSKRRHCKKNKKSNTTRDKHGKLDSIAVDNSPVLISSKEKEIHTSLDADDVPGLSDSESITESIESPRLSTLSLKKEQEHHHYYSLFSTGFDFPVTHTAAFNLPPPQQQRKKVYYRRSLVEMLDQDQQAQTTITPAAFSYFDDMMMSTSLYKYDSTTYHTHPIDFKKQWDSFAR